MVLLCAAIRRDSVSLLRFPFHSHVQVFLCEILSVCLLKYPYSYFSSRFCFLVNVLFVLILSPLLLAAVISLSLLFLTYFLLLFLRHTVCLCHCSNVKPCASSLIFLFFPCPLKKWSWVSRKGTTQVFISLMRFLLLTLVSRNVLVRLRYPFFIYSSFSTCLMVSVFDIIILFSKHSDSFLI